MSRRFFRLLIDVRGAVIIEFAIVAPVLVVMMAGVVDISNAFGRKLVLEQGTQRAIEKIMQTTEQDTVEGTLKTEVICQVNGMNADGTCKSAPITTSNVTVTYRLECKAGGAISTQTSTDATAFDALTCPVGSTGQARYISVSARDKYTPLFPIDFGTLNADGTYHLSATAGIRTQ